MMSLVALIYNFINGIRAFVGLVIPLFAEAADFKKWPRWLKALVGFILFGLTLWFLYWVQPKIHIGKFNFRDWLTTRAQGWMIPYFLPSAFVLMVAVFWLAHGLYKLLTTSDDATEFADIREAWTEAVARLTREGLRPGDLPLYVVLGKPAAGLDRLFLACKPSGCLRTPGDSKGAKFHPLRVYAWEEAVFVTCPGASGWGQFCHKLTNQDEDAPMEAGEDGAGPRNPYQTIDIGGMGGLDPLGNQRMKELISKGSSGGRTPDEDAELRELYEAANAAVTRKRAVTLGEDDRELQLRRLRYLCKLIRSERQPWCPLNGVLVLVPWAATEVEETARNGAGILAAELDGLRTEFRQRYPTFAMVTDLEQAVGFEEFRSGFLPDMLKQRLGQKLPLVPEFKTRQGSNDPAAELVAGAARWIGLSVVPSFILRFLSLESRDPRHKDEATVALHNRRLYTLMRAVFDRGPRLGTVLADGVPGVGGSDDLAPLPLFGGCYFTATGDNPKQQAFVPGAFAKLIEAQDKVAWAPEAITEDARLKQVVLIGWGVTAGLALVVLAGVVKLVKG